ncbi:hypothetical protein GCM10010507_19390 [Streptomyces cinnamoneus]|uniref:Uncharacterized protein n=1 Tax=Streptomyces cinnamoneus TaxID=53446 RepID=A0A918TDZ9_STRCJ|nr:hypothetical protein GCM10010507_19390 [Streptomyces cinnamoneus]
MEGPARLVDRVAAPDGPRGKRAAGLPGGEGVELYAGSKDAGSHPREVAPVDGVFPARVVEAVAVPCHNSR